MDSARQGQGRDRPAVRYSVCQLSARSSTGIGGGCPGPGGPIPGWLSTLAPGGTIRQQGPARVAKRALDITAATAGLLGSLPLIAGTGLAVRASMGSPVLFRQQRVGQDESIFQIYKFRSMRDPAYPGEPDEARLTRVGRFIRSTSLDELPQLINILKGDMSLIGPRPLLVRYLPRYSARQRLRHSVLPGLTGWAQVCGRNSLSWEDKFEHDVWYVEHWSIGLDLKILLRTIGSVAKRSGVSAEGQATMSEFMGSPPAEAI